MCRENVYSILVNRRVDFSDTASVLQYSYFFIPPRRTARLYFSALHVTRCITNCSEWWEPLPDLAQGKPPLCGSASVSPSTSEVRRTPRVCPAVFQCPSMIPNWPMWEDLCPVPELASEAVQACVRSHHSTGYSLQLTLEEWAPKVGSKQQGIRPRGCCCWHSLGIQKVCKKKKSIANQPLPCQPCWGNASYK